MDGVMRPAQSAVVMSCGINRASQLFVPDEPAIAGDEPGVVVMRSFIGTIDAAVQTVES
jgi:hypothetical protein